MLLYLRAPMERCDANSLAVVVVLLPRRQLCFSFTAFEHVSPSACDFITRLLVRDPQQRMTLAQAQVSCSREVGREDTSRQQQHD